MSQDASLLGRLAVHFKLITPQQATAALTAQGQPGEHRRYGEMLVAMRFITPEQLTWLLEAQEKYLAKQGGAAPGAPAPAAAAPAPSPAQAQAAAQAQARAQAAAQAQAQASRVPSPGGMRPGTPAPAPAPAAAGRPAAPAPAPAAAPAPAPAAAPSPVATAAPAGPIAAGNVRTIQDALLRAVQMNASDLHVHAGAHMQLRIGGKLVNDSPQPLSRDATERLLLGALTPEQQELLQKNREIDFAYTIPGVGRFRANVFRQQRGLDGVFRPIAPEPPTLEQLGLPSMLAKLTSYHQGLVLLTGPAGCGKSSTLAALVNLINADREDHIITVEDPIEYIHKSKGCVVNQRQAGKHTASFASALRAALREDPDIIVIGELRDLETISLAISAAETGHLVLGTLHTNSTIRTINRILDAFPPKQQPQIRAMVSESLRAVVSQRLVPTAADPNKRVPALEVLFVKPAISNLIRDQKTFQIRSILQTARSEGMCLLDDSLLDLVKAGIITKEVARKFCDEPKRFA